MTWPTSDYLFGFDAGIRLAKRLPLWYYADYGDTGVQIRRIQEHTLEPEDVLSRTWPEIRGLKEFQDFLDEISTLIENTTKTERSKSHDKSESKAR